MISPPALELGAVLPLILLAAGSFAVLVADLWLSARGTDPTRLGSVLVGLAGLALLLAGVSGVRGFATGASLHLNVAHPLVDLDRLACFGIVLVAGLGLLACMLSNGYLQERRLHAGEYYALLLLSTCGMTLLVSSVDLLATFLGIELLSIPLYVLAGFDRDRVASNESGLKYFLLGSFASAVLLYGMALLYGTTGSTHYVGVAAGLASGGAAAGVGVGLLLVGFAFKIAVAPFHQWAPDVYEGAPTPVTAFMAVTVKVAAFTALLRLLGTALHPLPQLGGALMMLAVSSMLIGNLMALIQDSVKRMLAYSSIAHAGYALVPLATGLPDGRAALLFYLVVYALATLGAFAVMIALTERGQEAERFVDYEGLASRRPALAAAATLFLLSLAGLPGTAGFLGKLEVFRAAVAGDRPAVALAVALTSALSFVFYLRLPIAMYMRPRGARSHRLQTDALELGVLVACAALVLVLGLWPNHLDALRLLDWARASSTGLVAPG